MYKAVILTPGRTGSHLILKNLTQYFREDWEYEKVKGGRGIVHTHNPDFVPPVNDFIGILSRRRDQFSAILSSILARKTGEHGYYTGKTVEPFSIGRGNFLNEYHFHKTFFSRVHCHRYSKIVDVYYEDMLADRYYLFGQLGIRASCIYPGEKSPYRYDDLVTNVNELRDYYNELELGIDDYQG